MTQTIQPGSIVELRFSLSLSDGTLIEETGDEPDTITIGGGDIVAGLESLLIGQATGGKVHEKITADQNLFGQRDDENIQFIPLNEFDEDSRPVAGQIIEFSLPNSQTVPGRITHVDENVAIVDFNHPLAGRDLVFKAEIYSVQID